MQMKTEAQIETQRWTERSRDKAEQQQTKTGRHDVGRDRDDSKTRTERGSH